MDLRRLRYIVRLAEERSFTRAAQSLSVSQPTLSQQVRDIELELDVILFSRGGRRVETTEVGAIVVDHARLVLSAVRTLNEAVLEHRGLKRGRLHIGVTQTFNALYLPPILTAFAREYPAIDLEVSELSNDEIVAQITVGQLHLGVGIPADIDNEHADPLYRDKLVFVCHARHRLSGLPTVPVDQLRSESLALLADKYQTRAAVEAYLNAAGVTPNRVTSFNTFAAILQSVSLCGHSAIVPADLGRADGLSDLRFIALDPAPAERVICLLSGSIGRRTPASDEMARRIRAVFARPS